MRAQELKTLDTDIQTLGFTIPSEVVKYEDYLAKLDTIKHADARRELQGVNTVDDIEAEVNQRTDDVIRAAAKGEQIRLMRDSVHRHIEVAYINTTDDLIDELAPIAHKAHDTIMKAADKLGTISTDAAVAARDLKSYDQAMQAFDTLETAHRIRMRLHALDTPDIERQVLRRVYTWRFDNLDAWRAYDHLGDAGSPVTNHVATARTNGITFAWLTTDQAEQQSHMLGKMQTAENRGELEAGMVFDKESMVYRVGADAWKYL